MNRRVKLATIILVTIGILLYLTTIISTNHNESDIENSIEIMKEVRGNATNYMVLADFITAKLDTAFYGEFRARPDSFYFFYLTHDEINNFFRPTHDQYKIFELAKQIGVTSVWKNNSENFFRFEIQKSFNVKPKVIVLKHSENRFNFRSGSKMEKAKVLSSEDQLRQNSNSGVLYKLNDRILIYF